MKRFFCMVVVACSLTVVGMAGCSPRRDKASETAGALDTSQTSKDNASNGKRSENSELSLRLSKTDRVLSKHKMKYLVAERSQMPNTPSNSKHAFIRDGHIRVICHDPTLSRDLDIPSARHALFVGDQLLLVITDNKELYLWDLKENKPVAQKQLPSAGIFVGPSTDGDFLVVDSTGALWQGVIDGVEVERTINGPLEEDAMWFNYGVSLKERSGAPQHRVKH